MMLMSIVLIYTLNGMKDITLTWFTEDNPITSQFSNSLDQLSHSCGSYPVVT